MNAPLHTKALKIASEAGAPERAAVNARMIERQLLAKSFPDKDDITTEQMFAANRRAIALTFVPEAAVTNFMAMSVGERRHRAEVAQMESIRQRILAAKPNADAAYHLGLADQRRAEVAALKAIGL